MTVQVEDILFVNVVLVGADLLTTASEIAAFNLAIGKELHEGGTFFEAAPQTAPVP